MEKVMRHGKRDNRRRRGGAMGTQKLTPPVRAALVLPALALLALAAGCGGDGSGQRTAGDAGAGADHAGRQVAAGCALVTDRSAVDQFYALADRVAAGEDLSLEEMGQVVSAPAWEHWRRSYEPERVPASRIARALFITLRGQDELPPRLRDKPYRVDLVRNYEVALEHREQILPYLERFIADEVICGVPQYLEGWLPAAVRTDTLHVEFVVGQPEIRLYEDRFLVDPGMAWAAGREQMVRFLASTLYRHVAVIEGTDPDRASGPQIALECLRVVHNEGIPAYLDRVADIAFDGRHPLLASRGAVPERFCEQAMRTLESLDATLARLRAWPDADDEQWQQVLRLFIGSQSWRPTGWYMARVIAAELGEERLEEVSPSVAGFWAAYAEAAARTPAEPTAAPGTVPYFLQQAPPLSAENVAWMEAELTRLFP